MLTPICVNFMDVNNLRKIWTEMYLLDVTKMNIAA